MTRLSATERKAFYLRGLEDHRHLLKAAIGRMAEGDLIHAITIATSIRALVHEAGSSKPVLKHLRPDYLSLRIYSAKEPEADPRFAHLRQKTALKIAASIMISDGKFSLRPTLDIADCQEHTLGHWWNDAGLIVPGGVPLSRKDIILGIANKEGVHLDDDMPTAYRIMLESKSLRIKVNDSDFEVVNLTRYVCGTAGVELVECLERNFQTAEEN